MSISRPVGALNLYARDPGAFTAADRARALSLAAQAAGAVSLAARLAEHEEQTRNLRTALSSRSVIDQAMGVVMAQNRCDASAAFQILRSASQGKAEFTMEFSRYAPLPNALAEELIKKYREELAKKAK